MRIEILVGNSEEPLIYPLNKPKLSVGSGETCDIIVDAPNVSRKHVQIATEGDSYFVIDQGSTNGTFINEERLVPGRRTEFTSFFPVRLGDSVLITLLSDEEVSPDEPPSLSFPESENATVPLSGRGSDESTKMISLRDLNKAKTSDLVSRRQKIVKKKASESTPKTSPKTGKPKSKRAQDKSHMLKIQIFVLIFIGMAGYVNFFVLEPEKEVKIAKIGEVVPPDPNAEAIKEKAPEVVYVVPEDQLPSREKVENLLGDLKCTLDVEKYFCEKIYKGNEYPFGSVQVGSTMFILSDGEFFYNEAKRFLPLPKSSSPDGKHTPEELDRYEKDLREVMAAIYLLRAVPGDLDPEMTKDLRLAIGLFLKTPEGENKLSTVISILPSSLKEFKRLFEEVHLANTTKIGVSAIEFVEKYYRVY
jgi:pSer/pThr/pTyr-binding forkhead associated (FHA) protein